MKKRTFICLTSGAVLLCGALFLNVAMQFDSTSNYKKVMDSGEMTALEDQGDPIEMTKEEYEALNTLEDDSSSETTSNSSNNNEKTTNSENGEEIEKGTLSEDEVWKAFLNREPLQIKISDSEEEKVVSQAKAFYNELNENPLDYEVFNVFMENYCNYQENPTTDNFLKLSESLDSVAISFNNLGK